jgi:hypothetical protein
MAGLNFKLENHRKRLSYVEQLDKASVTNIVKAVKKAEMDIAALQ